MIRSLKVVDSEKVRYLCILYTHTTHYTHTNTVVALAQAEIEVKSKLQVGARLTDITKENVKIK